MAIIRQILPVFYGMAVFMSAVAGTRQTTRVATTRVATTEAAQNYEIPNDFEAYVPTPPSPENVNCYIEVPMVQTVGGRCIRFGRSQRWSCQSGIHMQISDGCERLSRRNEQRRRTRAPRS